MGAALAKLALVIFFILLVMTAFPAVLATAVTLIHAWGG